MLCVINDPTYTHKMTLVNLFFRKEWQLFFRLEAKIIENFLSEDCIEISE